MPFKTPCYFRTRIRVCTFKEEDCNPDSCDLHDLPWDAKALFKRIKQLRTENKKLEKTLKTLKKTDREGYKAAKKRIKDNFAGGVYLTKAIMSIKRSKK